MTTLSNVSEQAVSALEVEFKDRGLKFTSGFQGLEPIQAYGHIDGLRFYFRERGGRASLNVGPYDRKLEEAIAESHMAEAFNSSTDNSDSFSATRFLHSLHAAVVEEDTLDYYPTRVVKSSAINLNDLTDDFERSPHGYGYFSELVRRLEPVKEDDQISDYYKSLLS